MTLENIKSAIPECAKDIKLNLSNLLNTIDQSGLTEVQFYGISLAVAYALKNNDIINMLKSNTDSLSDNVINAAKIAAVLMSMNNVYYRAVHLSEDKGLISMPAGLRMNGIMQSGIDKIDFELMSLGISAINGCGMCISSHIKQLVHHGVTQQGIQTTLKLAAVLNALNFSLDPILK